jgi:hypothetical protein
MVASSVTCQDVVLQGSKQVPERSLRKVPGETLWRDTARVLATGGTVAGASFLVEISPLDGRKRLRAHRIESGIIS